MAEDKEQMEDEIIEIPVKVKESKIEKSGIARIHEDVLAKLGAEEGDDIEVFVKNDEDEKENSALVTIYADTIISKDEISLRKNERKKLDVKGGDDVILSPFETIRKKVTDNSDKVTDKVKDTFSGKEEEEEEGEEEKEKK